MRVKFGYKTFAAKTVPLVHPKRPFDKAKDFTQTMDLYVYLTPTGLVSKTKKERISPIQFGNYTSDGLAYVYIHDISSWKVISTERIHRKKDLT